MKIISLASTDWNSRWMNRQQLLSRLGRQHTVLYSNASWKTWDRHRPEWKASTLGGSFSLRDNVWVESVPRFMMRSPRLPLLDRFVTKAHARRWLAWIAKRGQGPLIFHMFHPSYVDYVPFVDADAVIYHPYDRFDFMPGWSPELEVAEQRLLALADIVITPSETFSKVLEKKSGRPVLVVPNGVDIDLFERAADLREPAPPDLASIPHPRIGYIGWLELHVDLDLIATLAARRPHWHFVFVGGQTPQANERLAQELQRCREFSNIHFLGPKQRAEVPAYMLNMDVNTICWRLEEGSWADFGYPLKLQEYLACGRPIVSADLHSVRSSLSHVIQTARNAEEWESALDEALSSGGKGSPRERISIARTNSWDRRSEQLVGILEGVSNGRRSA